ncbi:unnamed protein product [Moneuplotes crassus]|uniref:POPDC1-3 domain-containing protein n=1 Tax=Euplotes crassus TaxID=5936 RepID=A0AAD1UQD9_EUPCR|nr:unnamed protein product [Moneuplotes crassus]
MVSSKFSKFNSFYQKIIRNISELKLQYSVPLVLSVMTLINFVCIAHEDENKESRQLFLDDITDDLDWRKPLHQVAAGLVFLAWLQWYSFLFRSLLIAGEVCFIVWACVYPSKLELDTIIWNGVLIVINLIHILMFMLSFVKPKLTQKEREIYQQDFKLYFREGDFKQLMKYAEVEVVRSSETLIKQNERISELIYCHIISKGSKCQLSHNGSDIYSVNNADWLSIYDCYHAVNSGNFPWNMTAKVQVPNNRAHFEIVKFNLDELKKYFSKQGQARRVRNAFYAYLFHKRMQYLDQKVCTPDVLYRSSKESKTDYLKSFVHQKAKPMPQDSSSIEEPVEVDGSGEIIKVRREDSKIEQYVSNNPLKGSSKRNKKRTITTIFKREKSVCSDSECSYCGNVGQDSTSLNANEKEKREEYDLSSDEESKYQVNHMKTKLQFL